MDKEIKFWSIPAGIPWETLRYEAGVLLETPVLYDLLWWTTIFVFLTGFAALDLVNIGNEAFGSFLVV